MAKPGHNRLSIHRPSGQAGHSLIEVLAVLSLLGILFAAGGYALFGGLGTVQARGAAQAWQAAATWAQTGAIWLGADGDLSFASEHLAVEASPGIYGEDLGGSAPAVPVLTNVARWRADQAVVVGFAGGTAYPDSAGSLFFEAPGADYRVIVRLESGLTTRTRVETTP